MSLHPRASARSRPLARAALASIALTASVVLSVGTQSGADGPGVVLTTVDVPAVPGGEVGALVDTLGDGRLVVRIDQTGTFSSQLAVFDPSDDSVFTLPEGFDLLSGDGVAAFRIVAEDTPGSASQEFRLERFDVATRQTTSTPLDLTDHMPPQTGFGPGLARLIAADSSGSLLAIVGVSPSSSVPNTRFLYDGIADELLAPASIGVPHDDIEVRSISADADVIQYRTTFADGRESSVELTRSTGLIRSVDQPVDDDSLGLEWTHSPDMKWVLFHSQQANLLPGLDARGRVYRRQVSSGATDVVTVSNDVLTFAVSDGGRVTVVSKSFPRRVFAWERGGQPTIEVTGALPADRSVSTLYTAAAAPGPQVHVNADGTLLDMGVGSIDDSGFFSIVRAELEPTGPTDSLPSTTVPPVTTPLPAAPVGVAQHLDVRLPNGATVEGIALARSGATAAIRDEFTSWHLDMTGAALAPIVISRAITRPDRVWGFNAPATLIRQTVSIGDIDSFELSLPVVESHESGGPDRASISEIFGASDDGRFVGFLARFVNISQRERLYVYDTESEMIVLEIASTDAARLSIHDSRMAPRFAAGGDYVLVNTSSGGSTRWTRWSLVDGSSDSVEEPADNNRRWWLVSDDLAWSAYVRSDVDGDDFVVVERSTGDVQTVPIADQHLLDVSVHHGGLVIASRYRSEGDGYDIVWWTDHGGLRAVDVGTAFDRTDPETSVELSDLVASRDGRRVWFTTFRPDTRCCPVRGRTQLWTAAIEQDASPPPTTVPPTTVPPTTVPPTTVPPTTVPPTTVPPTTVPPTQPGNDAPTLRPPRSTGAVRLTAVRSPSSVPASATVCTDAIGEPGEYVVVNVTPVDVVAPGFGVIHSSDEAAGETSNVNYTPGTIDPNVAFAIVGRDGRICFTNSEHGPVGVIIDQLMVVGRDSFRTPASSGAVRLVNTRDTQPLAASATLCVEAAGRPGEVAGVNVTPVDAVTGGFGVLHSSDAPAGRTSSVNFGPATVDPNVAFATIGAAGKICFTNSEHGPVNVIIDQLVVVTAGTFVPPTDGAAERVLDTRATAPVPISGTVCIAVSGEPGDFVGLNITPLNAVTGGFGVVHSSDEPAGATSNVNFGAGTVDPNVALAEVGSDGEICFTNSEHGEIDVVIDQLVIASK